MSTKVTTIVVTERELTGEEAFWSLADVCERTALSREVIAELVDLGLVTPNGKGDDWHFPDPALARLQRANRLRRELELDWAGVAVALDLLEEVQQLRNEIDALKKQLFTTR